MFRGVPDHPLPESNPARPAAPTPKGDGALPEGPGSLLDAGQALAGGPMSERPEGPAPSGGAVPTGVEDAGAASDGGALNGGGKLGAHTEALDVLRPPGVQDAGAAFTVCLGPLALSVICKSLSSFAFKCALIDASSVRCNVRSSRASCSKASLILLEESDRGCGIATAQQKEARGDRRSTKLNA